MVNTHSRRGPLISGSNLTPAYRCSVQGVCLPLSFPVFLSFCLSFFSTLLHLSVSLLFLYSSLSIFLLLIAFISLYPFLTPSFSPFLSLSLSLPLFPPLSLCLYQL